MVDILLRRRFGLLGRNISYSFSKGYFTEKFNNEVFAGNSYENFDISEINYFTELIKNNPDLKGLNVTIPYKEQVIPMVLLIPLKFAFYYQLAIKPGIYVLIFRWFPPTQIRPTKQLSEMLEVV